MSKQFGKTGSAVGQRRTNPPDSTFQSRRFLQRELTSDEQKACKAWEAFVDRADDMLAAWLDAGGKVSARYDEFNRSYACWLIPSDGDTGKAGLILSGRGSTPMKALKQAFFKHYVVFEEEWPAEIDTRGPIDIDD